MRGPTLAERSAHRDDGPNVSSWSPTRTEGPAEAIRGPLASADLPAEQDTGAAIRAAAKQLSPIGPRRASLMLAIPYPKRSRTDLKRPK
jgi:hypothetical protein